MLMAYCACRPSPPGRPEADSFEQGWTVMFIQVPGAPCLFRRLDCFDGGVAVAEDEQPGGLCAPWAGLCPEHAGVDRGELGVGDAASWR